MQTQNLIRNVEEKFLYLEERSSISKHLTEITDENYSVVGEFARVKCQMFKKNVLKKPWFFKCFQNTPKKIIQALKAMTFKFCSKSNFPSNLAALSFKFGWLVSKRIYKENL